MEQERNGISLKSITSMHQTNEMTRLGEADRWVKEWKRIRVVPQCVPTHSKST